MRLRSLSLAVFLAVCAAPGWAQTGPTVAFGPKSVLVLLGGSPGRPYSATIAAAMRSTFVSALSTGVSIETEHVDLGRFTRVDDEQHLRELFRIKHARSFDVIVAVGPESLRFLRRHRDGLWPGVPVIVCEVDERNPDLQVLPPATMAITLRLDYAGTLRVALGLLPDTRHVALLGGASRQDQANNDRIRQAVQVTSDRLDIIDLTDLPIERLLERLSTLPERTIILTSSYLADATGRRFFGVEVRRPMVAAANRPTFTVFGHSLGGGVVGGSVVDYEGIGREAGEFALRVLRGEPLAASPVRSRASNVPLFDWRQLRRWGLDETRLPPGSRVLYREPTLWEQYRWHVAGAVALLAAQAALIAGLLVERQRRRRAQEDLAERLGFEMLIADVSIPLTSLPAAELDEHIRAGLRRIATFLGVDRATLWQLSASGQAMSSTHAWTVEGAAPPPAMVTLGTFPFLRRLYEDREVFSTASLDELPAEALADRQALEPIGVQSLVVIPLAIADRLLGALMFVTLHEPHPWPEGLVRRLQVLGEPFASALARREAETALETSEAFTRAALAAPQGEAAIVDGEGEIVLVNEAWAEKARAAGGFLADMIPGRNYLEACRNLANKGDANAQRALTLIESVLLGRYDNGVLEYPQPQADRDRWFEIRVRRLKPPAGGAAITHDEITSRKRAEADAKRHLNEIAHMDRVAAMGELASSFAHELNQPLAAILTNAQAAQHLLTTTAPDLDEFKECLEDIVEADRRAGEVIRRMRRLLKNEPPELQPINLNDLTRNVTALIMNDAILRNVSIELQLAPSLPDVPGDPVQIQQVILNLLSNGISAATEAVIVRKVTVWTATHDGHVELGVRDSGRGIAEEHLTRLFEPFFTTKPEGLGMGLTISRSIIDAHSGRIAAENDPRGGASFRVQLPHEPKPPA